MRVSLMTVLVAFLLTLAACAAPAAAPTPTTAPAVPPTEAPADTTAMTDTDTTTDTDMMTDTDAMTDTDMVTDTETMTDTDATTDTSSTEPAEVSFSIFADPAEFEAYEELVAAFETEYPNIHVNLSNVPDEEEYRERLIIGFANGRAPDVILTDYQEVGAYIENGLTPIQPYLEKSTVMSAEDFYQPTIDALTYDGQLWCIPQNMSSLVVYYNKALFDEAGVDYPSADWTWDEFVETAKALTKDTDGDGTTDQFGVGVSPSLFRMAPFIWSNGGELFDDATNPTHLTLDNPETQEVIQAFVDLQVTDKVVPDAVSESAENTESRFLNGRLGMWLNSRRVTTTLRTIDSFEWDAVHIPAFKESVTILHSDGFCLNKDAENLDAAWTFIEYTNGPEGQDVLARTGRTVPSLISVAESDAFLDDNPPANAQEVFLDTLPTIRSMPVFPAFGNMEERVNEELKRAFYGNATVDEVITEAMEAADRIINR